MTKHMQADVLLYPTSSPTWEQLEKNIVVIDVLRATSTVVTALANGAAEVIPVDDPGEAIQLAKKLGEDQCLTGGERGGLPIPGLDLGNSPLEYTREVVGGKKLALCTTNGTKAIRWANSGKKVLIASFLNAGSVVAQLQRDASDVLIVCAGCAGGFAMEDLLCAGLLVESLSARLPGLELSDAAVLAGMAYKDAATRGLAEALVRTEHGKDLESLGLGDDVRYCARTDVFALVPVYAGGRIVLPE